jgi:protein O-mannosyl-transferase
MTPIGEQRRRLAMGAAAIVLATVAVHGRTLAFDFSYLDDDVLVLEQQAFLSQPSGVWRAFARPYFPSSGRDHAYYRPIVTASYGFDALRADGGAGTDASGYHLTNVAAHALAAVLLAVLLRRLGHRDGVALFGGLLFAVHPALTGAVAWIPGRNDTLLAMFSLAAWLLFLGAADPSDGPRREQRRQYLLRTAHALAWLAALLCKETALVLPVVMLGHRAIVQRRPPAAWMLVAWASALATYLAARTAVLPHQLGAGGAQVGALFERASGLLTALGKLVLPVNLAVLATPRDTSLVPGLVALGLVTALIILLRARRRPLLFAVAALAAFVAPSLPTSGLLTLESRLVMPAVAMVLFACEIAAHLPGSARAHAVAGGVLVAAMGVAAFSYGGQFRDRLTFARAAVEGSPHSSLAHRNLGVAYQVAGQPELARRAYEEALAQNPDEPVVHNNLAVLLMAEGRLPEAERHLHAELAINPGYPPAQANLAKVVAALARH